MNQERTSTSSRRSYPGHIAIPLTASVAAAMSIALLFLPGRNGLSSDEDFATDLVDAFFSYGGPIFVAAGMFGWYQSLVERSLRSTGQVSRLVIMLRIVAILVAAAVIFGTVYLSAVLDQRIWRNSISAYQHSSGGLLFSLAGIGLAYLLITEATVNERWTFLGRTVALHKASDEVRIGSAFFACLLVIYPTAPEGGDLYSNSSVLHGFASLGLFLGLTTMAGMYWIENRSADVKSGVRLERVLSGIHCLVVCLMMATVVLCITVVALKVSGGLLFALEVVALGLYLVAFTIRNRARVKQAWRSMRNEVDSQRPGSDGSSIN